MFKENFAEGKQYKISTGGKLKRLLNSGYSSVCMLVGCRNCSWPILQKAFTGVSQQRANR